MLDSVLEVVYLVGFIVAAAVRAWARLRTKSSRIQAKRPSKLDSALLSLTSLGMFLLPLTYLFTPWLGFLDYELPSWAGWLGVALFVSAL